MSLAKIIQEEDGTKPPVIPQETKNNVSESKDEPIEYELEPKELTEEEVGLIDLYSWFDKYHREQKTFEPKIKATNVQIADAIPNERLVVSILHHSGGKHPVTGNPLRKMVTFDNCNTYKVMDVPGYDMDFYADNSCRIIYHHGDHKFTKCYCVRTGLKVMHSTLVEGRLIPFTESKVNRKKEAVLVECCDPNIILQKLNTPLDKEAFVLVYNQFQKHMNDINTKIEAIDWLIDRSKNVSDINHQVLLDTTMISILST